MHCNFRRPGRWQLLTALLVAWAAGSTTAPAALPAAEPDPLATLSRVEGQGADNEAASRAWQKLAASRPEQLPELLAALDGATPLGANWIRAAVDAVAEHAVSQKQPLPVDKLEAFVKDRRHTPRARRLAYEWLVRADAGAPDRLIPGMLDDPSVELRRDAVRQILDKAAAAQTGGDQAGALAAYRQALDAARDQDQVKAASDALKKLGQPVELARHYGFIRHWHVIGPFDNSGKKGFAVAYPPEKELDLKAEYEGKTGPVRWLEHTTKDELGHVDLNALLTEQKGVIAYALAELTSPREQPVEIRMGTQDAIKLWLNGKPIYDVEVYHANVRMDQYVARGQLQAGRNLLLLKVCQNEQTEDWARDWKFQLRICDATGGAVPLEQ